MNKLFAAAIAAGMVGSATFLGGGIAMATETALIMPGTAPADGGPLKMLYHFNPASTPNIGANYYDSANANRQVVPYPASLWPITGKNSPTLGRSIAIGTNNLDSAIDGTSGPTVVTGLSQGNLALNAEQARLASDPNAPAPDQLTFITAGNPNHLFTKWLDPGTVIPVLNYAVPAPVDSQYNTVDVVGQYDIFSNPLDRPGNLLALVNAILAGGVSHTATAFTDPNQVGAQNVTVTTNSRGATTTTYFIPASELPMVKILRDMGAINDQTAAKLNVVLRPMIDRAYGPAPAPIVPANWTPPTLPALQNLANLPNIGGIAPVSIPLNAGVSAVNTANAVRTIQKFLPKGKNNKNKN